MSKYEAQRRKIEAAIDMLGSVNPMMFTWADARRLVLLGESAVDANERLVRLKLEIGTGK